MINNTRNFLMVALVLIACLFLVAFCIDAQAQSASPAFIAYCQQNLDPTSIRVRVTPSSMVYRYDASVNELSARSAREPLSSASHGRHVTLGLTESKFYTRATFSGRLMEDRLTRTACMRPSIDIEISVGPQTISIASEFPQGTCSFNAIMEHELRHARTNQSIAESIGSRLRQAIVQAYGQQIFYGDASSLQSGIIQNIESEWLTWASREADEGNALHAQIDTPDEYARMRTVCGGEVARLLLK